MTSSKSEGIPCSVFEDPLGSTLLDKQGASVPDLDLSAQAADKRHGHSLGYLLAFSSALMQTTDDDVILSRTICTLSRLFQPDMAMVFLLNEEKAALIPVKGCGWPLDLISDVPISDSTGAGMVDSPVARILHDKSSLLVEDFAESTLSLPPMMAAPGMGSGAIIPLLAHQVPIGILGLQWRTARGLAEVDLDTLNFVANILGSALERARLIREAEASRTESDIRAWELESRAQLSAALRKAHTPGQLAETFIAHIGRELKAEQGLIFHQVQIDGDAGRDMHLAAEYVAGGIAQSRTHVVPLAQPSPFLQLVAKQTDLLLFPADASAHAHLLTASERAIFGDRLDRTLFQGICRTEDGLFGLIALSWPNHGTLANFALSLAQRRLLVGVGQMAANALRRASTMDSLEQRVAERTEALQQANKQLQELDRLKSKFIADISEELRTPVTNLSFYLSLLENGRPEKRTEYVRVLRSETARLSRMIEGTLDLSQLEQRLANLVFSPQQLSPLLVEVESAMQGAFAAKGIDFHACWNDDLGSVTADHNRLHQVLVNLTTNSLRFTEEGEVVVCGFRDGPWICVQVADTGIGIPADELDRVFDRFYRASNATSAGMVGPGLGLSIAKQVMDLHGGEIVLTSEVGVGTTACIRLPQDPHMVGVI